MKKVIAVRHQAGGIFTEVFFAKEPTEEQMKPVLAMLAHRHGTHHPKLKEAYFVRFVEIPVLEESDLEELMKRTKLPESGGTPGEAASGIPTIRVQAEGKVVNPGDPGWVDNTVQKKNR